MYITPEISEEKARNILSQTHSRFLLKIGKKAVPPKRLEVIYLPFYSFEILLEEEGKNKNATLFLDGLLGNTLFFAGEDLKTQSKTDHPVCQFALSPAEAEKIVLEEYKWLLLEHRMRSRKRPRIEKITKTTKLFYPFWLGYFQKGQSYNFKALDGVSGQVQGIKMRKTFLKALRRMDNT